MLVAAHRKAITKPTWMSGWDTAFTNLPVFEQHNVISKSNMYSIVHKKVTVLLTSLAWPAWAVCNWAELFSQPGTNFFAQPCAYYLSLFQILSMNLPRITCACLQMDLWRVFLRNPSARHQQNEYGCPTPTIGCTCKHEKCIQYSYHVWFVHAPKLHSP